MINPFDLDKQRDLIFSADRPEQAEQAYLLLSGLPNCTVERGSTPNSLRIRYSLYDYTLEGLESALAGEGFQLDNSLLHSIGRKIIYYCEDTTCHNMDIPVHPTKQNQRGVFIKAWEEQPHGDRDETPTELRDYK
ncbi:MAG: hypothetical protein PHW66_08310 [Gallionella sp.]|jgi:hypothetical protein|nr:hypothetical protein [Gallionella sp.]